MKTLCVDARMAHSAGIGTCIREIVPRLRDAFKLVLLVSKPDQAWCKGIEQIEFTAPIYSIQEQLYYPFVIPQCDLFWSPHYNIPLLPIRAKKRVVTIHDACHLALSHLLSLPQKIYAKCVMKRALHASDIVITDSQFSKSELIRFLGTPKHPIHVIYPGVNPQEFCRVSDKSLLEKVKALYILPERFLLFVGSQKPHKNLNGLLDAFSNLSIPDIHLVIIGKSEGLMNVSKRVQMDKVHWLGEVPSNHLASLYTLAELFVFPSLYEGFGLPPLEAMSCGCPAVVSNAASLPEVCGDAAHYISPQSSIEISSTILDLLSNLTARNQLIQNGHVNADSFSWKKTTDLYLSALATIFNGLEA